MTEARPPFSASDAALEGVRIIGQRWRLMLGWALFNIVALAIIVVLTVILSVVLANVATTSAPVAVTLTLAGLAAMMVQVMIVTAIYRTELRFEEPGFMHLRLGPDELRMLAVWFLLLIGALIWVGASTTFVAWIQRETNTPLAWFVGIGCLAGLAYLWVRLSLVAPMTFDTHRLAFGGGWRLAGGRMIRLFGMTVIGLLILAMAAIVGRIGLWLLVGAASGFQDLGLLSMDAESLEGRPIAWTIQMVGEIVYFPMFWALVVTPPVAAYKHITGAQNL